jgi:DNA (cytosine-5)-methyltransferase 1
MARPLLLDLFCGAGGAAMGYYRAGFDVVGVDIAPQPHYPFEFWQREAVSTLEELISCGYLVRAGTIRQPDAIHASPPCQAWSTTKALHEVEYPELVEVVRPLLDATGLPYVIENVQGAPLLRQATFDRPRSAGVRLCGSSFGLGVRRHRLFEANLPLVGRLCRHELQPEPIDVTGTGGPRPGPRLDGGGGNSRKPHSMAEASEAMGIDWMTRSEIGEAIPPAYTKWIGKHLLEHIGVAV